MMGGMSHARPDRRQPEIEPREQFFRALRACLTDGSFGKLVFSKPRGGPVGLQRIDVRRIVLHGEPHMSFVQRRGVQDITRNLPVGEGLAEAERLAGDPFHHVHLFAGGEELQLRLGKKGNSHLSRSAAAAAAPPADAGHDRPRHRQVDPSRPFLVELGVTTSQQQVVPAMAKKWRQIDKFVELFAGAIGRSQLADETALRVVDFGAGKGYLTFAVHDWLVGRGVAAEVVGVELRQDLVDEGNQRALRLGCAGLRFERGAVQQREPAPLHVLIALHACDTATDHALFLGVRGGAEVILCAPCCHKEVRPQLRSPEPLRAILRHGVHQEREAEMLTDGLRALLLEAHGYDAQVFEFVSPEHTQKNKMILAVRRRNAAPDPAATAEVAAVKRFYGLEHLALERLLQGAG
jgi:protein-L-isoaspartate O-methyltransferase